MSSCLRIGEHNLNNIFKEKVYNIDYIEKHRLSNKRAGIELLGSDEIFVQYPRWNDYYGSNYGRLISTKHGKVELLKLVVCGGDGLDLYTGYKLAKKTYNEQRILTISSHRLVADIFLPNYWKNKDRNQLQAHHLDHSKNNNYYKNLILLPSELHNVMNRTKKMVLFKNGKFRTLTPYEIMVKTGLTLDEVILSAKGKPIKSYGKYSIFDVKGNLIGFQFFPKKPKKRK